MLNKTFSTLIMTILAASVILSALPMANAEINMPPTLSPNFGPPGTTVTVSAGPGGAGNFAIVTAYWENRTGPVLNSTAADNNGAYSMVVTIPEAINGEHWIVVNDGESESDGAKFTVTAGLVVTYYLGVAPSVGNGKIYVDGVLNTGQNVECNLWDVVNVTAVPDAGWRFARWIFGNNQSNPWYYTVTENMVIWAVFEQLPPDNFQTLNHNVTVETDMYVVETVSNSSVSEFAFNGTTIRFHVEGATGTTGFCNITIPSELMSGEFSIYNDDALLVNDVDYTETYNGTHYLFNITYEHSTHTIDITATTIIPEISSLITITLLSSTSLTILLVKKKLKHQHNTQIKH